MWGSTDFKVNSINAKTRKVTGNNPKTGAPITYSASSCTVFNPSGDVVDASTPPKAIKAGTPVMCKTMFGSTDFRATSVNIKTRKVTGNNPKTGKPITYSASDCTVGEPSASGKLMDKGNNKEIKKGSFVLCKTLVSSADITVDYIDMNKKTVTGNNPKTGKPITYSASSCSVANKPPPGAVYDKTTPPKAIMKGSYVKCTTYAGSTDFTVTSVDVALKKITGDNPKTGKPITYSASSCSVQNGIPPSALPPGSVYNKSKPPKEISKGTPVMCKTLFSSTDFIDNSIYLRH
jgi:nucleoid DNA-binding protein